MRQIESFDGTGVQPLVTAGTPYTIPIPAKPGLKVSIDSFLYTAGTTAHTVYFMRVLGRTTLTAAATTGSAVINIAADPGAGLTPANGIAANDWLVVQSSVTRLLYPVQVSSVSTLAITLTANSPYAFAAGDKVFFYGIKTDVEPESGLAHASYALAASTLVTISNATGNGLVSSSRMGEPILIYVDNITAQGTVNRITWLGVYESGSPISGFMGDGVGRPHEVLGSKVAALPWGQIFSGLGTLFGPILAKYLGGLIPTTGSVTPTTTTPTTTTPTVPVTPANPASPFAGLGTALAQWLASLIQAGTQQSAPAAPTTTFPPTFPTPTAPTSGS